MFGFLDPRRRRSGFMKSWGWTSHSKARRLGAAQRQVSQREVTMFQRRPGKWGDARQNHRLIHGSR